MKYRKAAALLLAVSMVAGVCACSSSKSEETTAADVTETEAAEAEGDLLYGYETFELTSDTLEDGVWPLVTADVYAGGENHSPQLSWEPVEGAALYVIYMVDPDANNWLHWKTNELTETELPEGWASADEYVGPCPPSGTTHTYDIYVIALRAPLERLKGVLGHANTTMASLILETDTDADGNTGNIIAYGRVSGTFTRE